MKGNIGLTNNIINKKVNDIQNLFGLTYYTNTIDSHAVQTHKQYTNILPHKQVYDPIFYEKDDTFCYEFAIKSNNPDKFLILKDLFLFSHDDVIVDEFYPNIISIIHEIKKNNDKLLLNEFDGESLKAINILCDYNNKYYLTLPIISSYGVINLLGTSYINLKIISSHKYNFKILGTFNNVVNDTEIKMFVQMQHKYLISPFHLHVKNVNKGNNIIKINNNLNDVHYRSIILITDEKARISGIIKTENFSTNINLITTMHLKLGNKIIFVITNSFNKKNDNICTYQPQGTIKTKCLNFEFVSEIDCSMKIICQQYNILLFKEM